MLYSDSHEPPFTVHEEKSITTPTQIITINSITQRKATPEKVTRTLTLCWQIFTAETVPPWLLAQRLEVLEPSAKFIYIFATCRQDLQEHNNQYNVCTRLTQASKTELAWWLTNLQQVSGRQIVAPLPDVIIFADISKFDLQQ